LAREKNARKEIVVHSKSQEKPSLPASIRIIGPAKAEWTCKSAWADLTQRLEMELEEKILRYKLSLKDRPKLEWSWQEVPNIGGVECTILAHIDTGSSALSIHNKRNLRWKAMELIPGMNNETEFAAPAHILLMKANLMNSSRLESKNRAASMQASPQAARKKRFMKLDISSTGTARTDGNTPARDETTRQVGDQEALPRDTSRNPGSIGEDAARNDLSYVG
jgi:hypothetical protein